MGMVAQRSFGVPIPGGIQTLAGQGAEQPNLTIKVGPASRRGLDEMTSRNPFKCKLFHYSFALQQCCAETFLQVLN